jgi:alkylation response protein AidB-like acyl-CoA dehydrogenase
MIDHADVAATDLLRQSAQSLLAARSPMGRVRSAIDSESGFDAELWRVTSELGWPGLGIPAQFGGSGLGLSAIVVLARELGRALAPSPYLGTFLAADLLLTQGSERQRAEYLPQLANGTARGAVAIGNGDPRTDGAMVVMPEGDGWQLTGTSGCVVDAGGADLLLVAVARPSGDSEVFLLAGEGVRTIGLRGLDRTRRLAEVRIDARVGPDRLLPGAGPDGGHGNGSAFDMGALLIAAELSGVAERVLELTVEFAKTRQQFGHPIGAFQAVAHRLADMYVRTSNLAALVDHAAAACEERWSSELVSIAKLWANQTAEAATSSSMQIHGAIGFTWEHDLHLYLRRTKSDTFLFGSSDWHRDRIATLEGWGTTN